MNGPITAKNTRRTKILQGGLLLSTTILTLVLYASCQPASQPQQPSAMIEISTNTCHVGDLIRVTLSVTHHSDQQPVLPIPVFTNDVEIISTSHRSKPIAQNWRKTSVTYTIEPFQTGVIRIFPDAVVRLSPGTNETLLLTGALITVQSLLSDTNAVIRPIKGPYLPPSPYIRYWIAASIALLVVLLVAILAVWTIRRRRRYTPPPPTQPPAGPTALEQLEQLRQSPLIQTPDPEPFYVELTRIVRQYIEDRFHIRAPELTTEEFVREASRSDSLTDSQQKMLQRFLEEADLVKFARYDLAPPDRARALEAAITFVRQTMAPPNREQPS